MTAPHGDDLPPDVERGQLGAIARALSAAGRSDLHLAALVFLLALVVRVGHYPSLLQEDFVKYPVHAARFMAGEDEATRPFTASPLYLYYWVGVGTLLHGSFEAGRICQLIIGSGSCALIALLGKGLFSPVAGALAGVVSAFYLPFLAHDGAFVSEPLVIFLNLLSLWAFLQARSERRWGLPLGSFSLGLSVATRPNALLFLPFFVAWALRVGERPHGSMRRGVLVFAAVCALGLVPPGLVTLRNWQVSGDFVPVMSDGGIVSYLGNNGMNSGFMYTWPRYEDLSGMLPGEVDPTHRIAHGIAEKEMGEKLSVGEAAAFWTRQVTGFWREKPLRALTIAVRKLGYTWTGYEAHDVASSFDIEDALRGRPYLLRFTLIGALGLVGAVWALGRFRQLLPLYALIATYTVTSVLLTVVARYRLPMVPALILLGANLVVEVVGLARSGSRRRLVAPLACTALLIWAMAYRNYPMRALDEQYWTQRVTLCPAEVALRAGEFEKARSLLDQTIAARPPFLVACRAHGLLSLLHAALGNHDLARTHRFLGRAWTVDKADPDILLPPTELIHDPLTHAWVRAAEHLRAGDAARARREFAGLTLLAADAAPLRYSLGLSLVRSGRVDDGLYELGLARMKDPSCLPVHQLIVRGRAPDAPTLVEEYSELAAKHPTQAGFRYGLALALDAAGRPEDARREMAAALDALGLDDRDRAL